MGSSGKCARDRETLMISMLATRLTSVILVMLVVTGLSFCIFNFLGDPVNNVLGVNATLAQREELLSTRQLAEVELAKLEQMLIEVEAPLQQKLRGYEQRIADLEDALRAKGNESKELIETMVRLTRQKLEAEREASAGAT